jgi:hypothetical protein
MSEPSVDQLQQDLEQRREAIDHTLDAIERRLSFREITANPLEYVQNSLLGEYGENLKDAVSSNPIPITLLGVSLAWLMMGGQRASARVGERLQESAAEAGESLESGAETVREKVQAGAETLQEKARGAAERIRGGGESVAAGARDSMRQARRGSEHYGRVLQEHPLALSFVGLALGAAMAALLPETQAENRLMGETRDRLAEQASAKGERVMEGARAAAQAGVTAAKEEAERQSGLGTP